MRTICAFVIICLFTACSSPKEKDDESKVLTVLPDEMSEVRAMRLEYTDFNHELIANGVISAQNRADLKFQVSENIAGIYVKNGVRVRKGQKLAELDPFKLKNSLEQAQDNLAKARLDLQDVLIGQGYSLNDSSKIPNDVLQLAKVKSNYNQSLNQYELAEYNYKNSVLYAPFDGVVANLFSKVYNHPDASQPFCTIIDNAHLEADFKILESELAVIRINDKVSVSPFSIDSYSCSGQVGEINPEVDNNGMVRVKAVLNNPDNRLYAGMNIKLHLQRSLGKQLVIPKEALVLRSNRKVVFKLENEHAVWVYVSTGLENSSGYVVTDGLAEGDSIIYEGNINLAHESPVRVKN
ncbi:cation transporter [Bacteroidia bacterium]|nr:cation transporter [Bacteroidia bacterium]